jgi:hypothetical protein
VKKYLLLDYSRASFDISKREIKLNTKKGEKLMLPSKSGEKPP